MKLGERLNQIRSLCWWRCDIGVVLVDIVVDTQMGCGISSDSANTENITPEPSEVQRQRAINVDQVWAKFILLLSNKLILFFFFVSSFQPARTILEAYQQFDEEICRLEGMCPATRLGTMDTWIQFLETQRTYSEKEVVQLPLHLLDENDTEEVEMRYDKREHLNHDIQAITKVRQVCIFFFLINHFFSD